MNFQCLYVCVSRKWIYWNLRSTHVVILPLWHRHSTFFSVTRKVTVVSARPLVFVLTLTLLQKTVKSIFWHPSETQAFAVHDHAFAQLSVIHCSAKRSVWSCRGEALGCIWPLKQHFIQGCGSVRSCFPKVIELVRSTWNLCWKMMVVSVYLTPANCFMCVMFTGLISLSAWDQ